MKQLLQRLIPFLRICHQGVANSNGCLHRISINSREGSGFSLIEVVLAIGVFAVAIVAVLGLMPGLLSKSRETWQETRAAHIARQIATDLQPVSEEDGLLVQAGEEGWLKIPLGTKETYLVRFDQNGNPVDSKSLEAVFRAEVRIDPLTRPGLSKVTMDIGNDRETSEVPPSRFVTFVSLPMMDTPK